LVQFLYAAFAVTFLSSCAAPDRAKYRKQEAPWLATAELGPDDPEAPMSLSEFRSLAWVAANETARGLGWIKGYDELHKAAKQVSG
jgi:hypothetical protein